MTAPFRRRFVGALQPPRRQSDRLDDLLITGTTAKIAADRLANFFLRWIGIASQQRMGRHEHARSTEAALQRMELAKRILQYAQPLRVGRQALDGGDLCAIGLHREKQAGKHPVAVQKNGAGAAHAVFAAGMRAGEIKRFTQEIDQRQTRRHGRAARLAVDGEIDAVLRHQIRPATAWSRASAMARATSTPAMRRRCAAEAWMSLIASMPPCARAAASVISLSSSLPPDSARSTAVRRTGLAPAPPRLTARRAHRPDLSSTR